MQILVTGGAGFIGSHLVDKLLEQGHIVVNIDNFDPYYSPDIKENNIINAIQNERYKIYREDILNSKKLDQIFSTHDFDVVVHLAAKAGVRPSIEDPVSYAKVNIEGTMNLLEQCKKYEIKKFIFASSSSVYGNNKTVPFSESDSVDNPVSPYAATKKSGELLCYNYHHLYDINIFALRFFTVYGPRQRPEMAIHKFTRRINNNEEIPVYGMGKPERDYTYIDDIIQGVLKSIQRVKGYEIINLGESSTISVTDLIHVIESTLGKTAKTQMLPMQPGDVSRTFANVSKARKILNFQPTTDINTGIQKFVNWYLETNLQGN